MANGENKPIKEFDLLRQKTRQRARQAGQEQVGAVQRKLAAFGGVSGGAGIKAASLAQQRAQEVGESSIQQLDLAEQQEGQRRKEIGEQRAFVSGEAEKGRTFGAEQARIGREFGAEQARVGREFGAGEAQKGRDFAAGQAEKDLAFRGQLFNFDKEIKLAQLDNTQKAFVAERQDQAFNKMISILDQPSFGLQVEGLRGLIDDPNTPQSSKLASAFFLRSFNSPSNDPKFRATRPSDDKLLGIDTPSLFEIGPVGF